MSRWATIRARTPEEVLGWMWLGTLAMLCLVSTTLTGTAALAAQSAALYLAGLYLAVQARAPFSFDRLRPCGTERRSWLRFALGASISGGWALLILASEPASWLLTLPAFAILNGLAALGWLSRGLPREVA